MPTLTKKQKEVYDFIEEQIAENGYAPSLPEIRDHFQISAVSTVHEHVTSLVKKGLLKRAKNVSRSLELVGQRFTDMMEVPLVGVITAGKPIEAIEIPDQVVEIAKDRRFQGGELYALKVHGNSMIGDGIFDGDFAIIKKQDYAADGDTVVAVIDDNEATLKRFYREKNRIRLQPANPTFSPIYRKEVEIRGIVVKIIREFGHH
ncbi:transcriptional repressor LexA [Candidatus Falkowbacteria bacterium]|nr:transcriptional repressor LexA [Patescibacteria group bacterium]NCU43304.1 transcriptional repressor LexA [Candidatus Falkowbacteria bacterium]